MLVISVGIALGSTCCPLPFLPPRIHTQVLVISGGTQGADGASPPHTLPPTHFPPPHTYTQVLVISGGIALGRKVQTVLRDAQQQQKALCENIVRSAGSFTGRPPVKIAVNKLFFKRLRLILSM